ncbi:YihY/virulence factor BrkB family protein [Noviherbaspirillum aerium]|uniref:YihY/virulence factor BrkB family protein n=1 Tax=Noviherbaspirillum aerium TaxID=2588497 RepID=UPI001CEF7016|nr:YihY/virulence factor BrkB family protein [Noviherbaspirillum aerium]
MRGPNQIDKEKIVHGLLQVTVAALSFLQLRKQTQRKQLKQQQQAFTSSQAALDPKRTRVRTGMERQGEVTAGRAQAEAKPETSAKAQVNQKPHEDLRHESRPKALLHIAISAAKEWSAHRAASKGAALALYTLFSLAPMLLLVVTIAGFFFGEDTVRQSLLEQMSKLMGAEGADAVKTILGGAKNESGGLIAGLVSLALVLVSATSAFSELKDSLDELWEVPPSTQSGLWAFVKERVLSFGLILVLALMLLMTLGVSTALATMEGVFGGGTTGTVLKTVTMVISHAVSFAVVAGLFAVIFKYLPATQIAWKDVFIGSIITAVLFIIGKFAIGLYVANADISSSYGAAGSVVILITWIYYSAQIFFYGSLFTHEYAMKVGSRAGTSNAEQAKPLPVNGSGARAVSP